MVYDEWFVRTLNFKIQFKSKIQDNVGVLVPRERRSHFNNNNNNNNDLFQTQSVHIQKHRKTKLVSERIYKCRHNKKTNKVHRLDTTHGYFQEYDRLMSIYNTYLMST